jgi:SlyX protein
MSEEQELAARLDELEVKFAFQQETIEALNSTVTDQWTEIDRLKKAMARLQDQVIDLEDTQGSNDPGNIKPPHY